MLTVWGRQQYNERQSVSGDFLSQGSRRMTVLFVLSLTEDDTLDSGLDRG